MMPLASLSQYCEYFETYSKTQLDSMGWDGSPNSGWSVSKTGGYSGKSLFLNAGIGSYMDLGSECNTSVNAKDTISFQYTFSSGSGIFAIGIQDGFATPGTSITWLDTLPVVSVWTYYSLSYPVLYNPYKITFHIESTSASNKIGIDNLCFSNSDAIGICMILPIELSDFSAEVINVEPNAASNKVQLSWVTQSEINTNSFVILRSGNNLSFDSVGIVKASGNSNLPIYYSYTDVPGSTGNFYYRLKMLDNDDSYTFSNTASAYILGNNPLVFASGVIQNTSGDEALLSIFSVEGKLVYSGNVVANSKIDLRFLLPGIYFVRHSQDQVMSIAIF